MNKINNNFREDVYQTYLENGLEVIYIHKPGFVSSYASMTTPFGAYDLKQQDKEGKSYSFHPGAAHFLEHKLFESEEQDVLSIFTSLGASGNAGTSYEMTTYYFNTSTSLEKPLNLLLDFVQNLSITDASVEKEKGIIIQELMMYEQRPDFKLYMEALKSLYINFPLKDDIGGSPQSVKATTREELELAYAMNYHPSRMLLVIVSGENPEKVMEIVEQNQSSKTFAAASGIQRVIDEEPVSVQREHYEFAMKVETQKNVLAYKLPLAHQDRKAQTKLEFACEMILDMNFSTLNPAYQSWLDQDIINDYFSYELSVEDGVSHLLFFFEGEDVKTLETIIQNQLTNLLLDEQLLEQLKRRFLGATIRMLGNFDRFAQQYAYRRLRGMDLFDYIEMAQSLTIEDLKHAHEHFNLQHRALINLLTK